MEREEGHGSDERETRGPAAVADGERVALDPEGFERRVAQYVEWLRVNHFSEKTAKERESRLRHFVAWCADRELLRPADITKPILESYQAHLFHHRRPKDGRPLSLGSQRNCLLAVRALFKWLARQNHVLSNPASDLLVPHLSGQLPRHVLTEQEAETIINLPDVSTPLGLRDRAILETLYSSGIRRIELCGLRVNDLDAERGTLMVRQGKGRKQRVVPIGDRAVAWVEKYLAEVRPDFVRGSAAGRPDEGHLFLTHKGGPIRPDQLTRLARGYVERAKLEKHGAAHIFRHSCATAMLEHGADVRYIQELLGHAKLETTQVYTRVSIAKLKEVHAATHPARLHVADSSTATPPAATSPELPSPPPAK